MNANEQVLEFFQNNAAEALSLVFKPVKSTIGDELAFRVVLRVYALEIVVPSPPLSAGGLGANAWVPKSPNVQPDYEYTATVRHWVEDGENIGWAESHNGVAKEWFTCFNRVEAHEVVASCDVIEHIKRSLPIELFFVHQKDRFLAWQELRASIIREMAETHISGTLARDKRRYY